MSAYFQSPNGAGSYVAVRSVKPRHVRGFLIFLTLSPTPNSPKVNVVGSTRSPHSLISLSFLASVHAMLYPEPRPPDALFSPPLHPAIPHLYFYICWCCE